MDQKAADRKLSWLFQESNFRKLHPTKINQGGEKNEIEKFMFHAY